MSFFVSVFEMISLSFRSWNMFVLRNHVQVTSHQYHFTAVVSLWKMTFYAKENIQPIPKVIKNWGPLGEISVNVLPTFDGKRPIRELCINIRSLLQFTRLFSSFAFQPQNIYLKRQIVRQNRLTEIPNGWFNKPDTAIM